ncbi:DUF5694 domain-containing protein [Cellulophaga baltica]|uniref:DUF5694 domain-containing protein n=1 Tax=Cellulophaga baltica TaxID=76594 RepID=UPI0003F864E2|nr:DUF5694 domain-containing protein [Cellulophaga baltica]
MIRNSILIITTFIFFSCTKDKKVNTNTQKQSVEENVTNDSSKIKVLNVGTFHMAGTSDAHKLEFDPENKKSISETYQIAQMIAAFNPTVICVERVPSENNNINIDYRNFLDNKEHKPNYPGEIGLIAYNVGKIAGVKTIYCIDEQETAPYNYAIYNELKNSTDSITAKEYIDSVIQNLSNIEKGSTLERLKALNTNDFYDIAINLNAEILTHTSSQSGFEGADEAAKFYRRNLRIYSNLNKIPLTKDDRVFILMGATHSAFLNEFLTRSPKYESVSVFDYLK